MGLGLRSPEPSCSVFTELLAVASGTERCQGAGAELSFAGWTRRAGSGSLGSGLAMPGRDAVPVGPEVSTGARLGKGLPRRRYRPPSFRDGPRLAPVTSLPSHPSTSIPGTQAGGRTPSELQSEETPGTPNRVLSHRLHGQGCSRGSRTWPGSHSLCPSFLPSRIQG